MLLFRTLPAAVAVVAAAGLLPFFPAGQTRSAPPTPKTVRTADPWEVATRDPALAKIYETTTNKLLLKIADPTKAVAADKHIAARLVELSRADPTNAFPMYLLAFQLAQYGDGNSKVVTTLLREANAAPRIIYPISGDVLTRAYPGGVVLRNMATVIGGVAASGNLPDAEAVALLTELRTAGSRISRLSEPRTPIMVAVGAAVRLTAEKGLAAVHDRAGRTTEAAAARAAEAKVRAWNQEAVRRMPTVLGYGGTESPDVLGAPLGITLGDIQNRLNGIPLASAKARARFPAFNRELALRERRLADRTLKEMPD